MLPLAPHNVPVECIIRGDQQLSGLTKNAGAIAVDAMLAKLLMEVSDLVSCNWSAAAIALYAGTMRNNFWQLRFDEIVYVLNTGVNGGYGKIYGALTYSMIAEWLTNYMTGERMEALEKVRQAKREIETAEHTEAMGSVLIPSEEDAAKGFTPMSMLDMWKHHSERLTAERRQQMMEEGRPGGGEDSHEKIMNYLRDNLARFTHDQLAEYSKQFSKTTYVLERGNDVPVERMLFPDAHKIVNEEIERRKKQQ